MGDTDLSAQKRVIRKEYEMTKAQYYAILAASQPVPYLVAGGIEPATPQENAHRAWQALGKELGFDWETVRPSECGDRFFTAIVSDPTYLTPCPVCGAEDDCPHTPVRCQHKWQYNSPTIIEGVQRTCTSCGRIEQAELTYKTVRA